MEDKTISALYDQTAKSCLHYSHILANFRILTISQGLITIAAATYLLRKPETDGSLMDGFEHLFSYFACLFGIILARFLRGCLVNYLSHFIGLVLFARALERKYVDHQIDIVDGNGETKTYFGPFDAYHCRRTDRFSNSLGWGTLFNNGSVILICIALFGIAFYDIARMATEAPPPLDPFVTMSMHRIDFIPEYLGCLSSLNGVDYWYATLYGVFPLLLALPWIDIIAIYLCKSTKRNVKRLKRYTFRISKRTVAFYCKTAAWTKTKITLLIARCKKKK